MNLLPHVSVRAALACTLFVAGCGHTKPDRRPLSESSARRDSVLRRSGASVPGVTLVLSIASSVVAPGDTVRFTATAMNATAQRIQIGEECGPPMDVAVTMPNGTERSALTDHEGGGYFTCELGPRHFVEPMSSRTEYISWSAPAVRGTYHAAAGLRRRDGLGNLGKPVSFVVR